MDGNFRYFTASKFNMDLITRFHCWLTSIFLKKKFTGNLLCPIIAHVSVIWWVCLFSRHHEQKVCICIHICMSCFLLTKQNKTLRFVKLLCPTSYVALCFSVIGAASVAFLAGSIAFFWLLFPATSPELFNSSFDRCSCWHGFCNWK